MRIGVDIRTLMDHEYSGVSEYTYNTLMSILKIDRQNTYKLFYNSWGNKIDNLSVFGIKPPQDLQGEEYSGHRNLRPGSDPARALRIYQP